MRSETARGELVEPRDRGSSFDRLRTSVVFVLVSAAIVALYFWRLAEAPVYLYHDEVLFAVQAHSISTTGRDVTGKFLPLYLRMGDFYWCSPEHIYLTALLLKIVHISDRVIRIPSVFMGLLSIGLMYALAAGVFRSRWYGLLAAVIVALTPALFIASRFKVESHYPLPFVIGWLLCLVRFDERRARVWLFAGGAVLGAGVYSYHASPVMMTFYVALTCAFLAWRRELDVRSVVSLVLGFLLTALPYMVFIARHPEYMQGEVATYKVYDADQLGLFQGMRQLLTWSSLVGRLSVYYDYFNPSFLFFSGGSSLLEATRQAGFFLLPLGVLLPVGIYHIFTRERERGGLFVAGFFTAPVAAALVVEPYATRRILFMIPFAGVVASYGMKRLLSSVSPVRRMTGVGLVAAIPLTFAAFYADYMGDYRTRSAFWFEHNVRGALEAAIDQATRTEPLPRIFISRRSNDFIEWFWKFYLQKHDRPSLESRTAYFDPRMSEAFPDGAIVVAEAAARDRLTSAAGGKLRELARIREPDGAVSFYVWRAETGDHGSR